jgi:hypothetical protein
MRDMVQIHITADLPIRARALPFANRIELRFGKAFPVALLVEQDALTQLTEAISSARDELQVASTLNAEDGTP